MRDVAVLIPAGGTGTRLGRRTPKQFLRVGREAILAATVRHFHRHPRVAAIVVAAPAAHVARARRLLGHGVQVVAGGATRQESVRLALEASPPGIALALVHDAVRPFITRALIDAVLAAARADGAAICALPVAETVKRVRDGLVEATVERAGLWAVQTPQAFRAAVLREAHDKARRDGVAGTDDAMLVERLGHPVRVVPGLVGNVKITTPDDLRRARGTLR
ncbi:MAG TPA: 2-C-methyl-D-erythritol 4-phosphate cytidylyltransferase [Methylomirabilota bacterium]|jgi:2-C-methyl-D-erythritol 4-phosphate cytidylyltransferase|nr:2-C-methyl-D-erythritol 4-phosphate cytidylyltransferase [Methylomirabilota bacterium]